MSEVAGQSEFGWCASLDLEFRPLDSRTVVSRRRHSGPLRVQRPFYPEGDVCHAYVLHPPGGVVGGDRLDVRVRVESGAAALLTTPAATKVYRSAEHPSMIEQRLQVAADATVEWLPQGTLLYGGSRLRQRSIYELASGARFFGWEITCLGRPYSGDTYEAGEFAQSLDIMVDGSPVLIERQDWRAQDALLGAPWGLHGRCVFGALYAYPADKDTAAVARAAMPAGELAATVVDGVLVIRALADDAVRMQAEFGSLWAALRPLVVGRQPCPPRIWST